MLGRREGIDLPVGRLADLEFQQLSWSMFIARARSSALVFALVSGLVAGPSPAVADPGRPFIWPTAGRVTQPFGCTGFFAEPPRGNCAHFHTGIDIANLRGTPILAAASGVIVIIGFDPWWPDRDWLLEIDHGNGLKTLYAHMRARPLPGIHRGAQVTQGQVIGYMSDTGMATGVHLHWGVYLNGEPVDPTQYVTGKLRGPTPRPVHQPPPVVSVCQPVPHLESGALVAMVLEGDDQNTSCAAA